MIVQFHIRFTKSYLKLSTDLKQATKDRLMLFESDAFHPILNNHRLLGKYEGHRSINITGDYRAHYEEISENEVIFVRLGTHSQLYG